MRSGAADGDGKGAPYGQFLAMAARSGGLVRLDDSGGADVGWVMAARHATPALLAAVQRQAAESDAMEPRVYWFGQTGLGMIESAGESPACPPHLVFFDASRTNASVVAPPSLSIAGNACTTLAIWAAIIGDVPVLVQQDDSVGASSEHLDLVPWINGAWGKPCGITAKYTMTFRDTGVFCRPHVECNRIQAAARGVALRFDEDMKKGLSFLADGAAEDVPNDLVELASQTKTLKTLPTFSQEANPWPAGPAGPDDSTSTPNIVRLVTGTVLTEHGYMGDRPPKPLPQQEIQMEMLPGTEYLHRYLYPVVLNRKVSPSGQGLGVIGAAKSVNSPIGGLLISIWTQSGTELTPLGGFQTAAVRGKVALVRTDSAL
jgi:hypothetical protein